MKKKIYIGLLLFIAIFIIIIISVVFGLSKSVTINARVYYWSSWNKPHKPSQIFNVRVREGQKFVDSIYYPYKKEKLFTLLEIINDSTVKVSFDTDKLVLQGEPVSLLVSSHTQLISNNKICFNTRTLDAGASYCLRVVQ